MAKIAIDCDGVLANFIEGFTTTANQMWPRRFPSNYWRTHDQWDFSEALISKAEVNQVWDRIKATPNWWILLPAHYDNVGALAIWLLTHSIHDVYIVTSRVPTVGSTIAMQTDSWLRACGVSPCHNHLGIIPVANSDEKADLYAIADIEFSIDDKAETVEICDTHLDLVKAGHKAFLLDRPWNQQAQVKRRVKNVDEYLQSVVGSRK